MHFAKHQALCALSGVERCFDIKKSTQLWEQITEIIAVTSIFNKEFGINMCVLFLWHYDLNNPMKTSYYNNQCVPSLLVTYCHLMSFIRKQTQGTVLQYLWIAPIIFSCQQQPRSLSHIHCLKNTPITLVIGLKCFFFNLQLYINQIVALYEIIYYYSNFNTTQRSNCIYSFPGERPHRSSFHGICNVPQTIFGECQVLFRLFSIRIGYWNYLLTPQKKKKTKTGDEWTFAIYCVDLT